MRISDWSSDVCSSDLGGGARESIEFIWRGTILIRTAAVHGMPAPIKSMRAPNSIHDAQPSAWMRRISCVSEAASLLLQRKGRPNPRHISRAAHTGLSADRHPNSISRSTTWRHSDKLMLQVQERDRKSTRLKS